MTRPDVPPVYEDHLGKLVQDRAKVKRIHTLRAAARELPYEHWDTLRFRPVPEPFTPEDLWLVVKNSRHLSRQGIALRDRSGTPFHYIAIPEFQQTLAEIDGHGRTFEVLEGASPQQRETILHKALIEEPFASAVLEGATTTGEIARKMIGSGRPPGAQDERMVLNAHEGMAFVRAHAGEPMTPARILEIHRIFTRDTLAEPHLAGALRTEAGETAGESLHNPPTAGDLPRRLQDLCDFANASDDLHPVIRAILLHFQLTYDQPFAQANGGTARALFYWNMAASGYRLAEHAAISAVIRRAPLRYGTAFLHSETDEGDVTYFILHQLDAIRQALGELNIYLQRKVREQRALANAMGTLEEKLNTRQVPLVRHAIKHPGGSYTSSEHSWHHGVSYLTARSDLEELTRLGLLRKTRVGTKSVYTTPRDLKDRLAAPPQQS